MVNESPFRYWDHSDLVQREFAPAAAKPFLRRVVGKFDSLNYIRLKRQTEEKAQALILRDYAEVYAAQMAARSEGGLAGDYQWARLAEIARLLTLFRPASGIEFGGGTSTVMFQLFLEGAFTTVEESQYWSDRMINSAPPRMRDKIHRLVVPRVVEEAEGRLICSYDLDHAIDAECVYVDGPYNEFNPESEPRVRKLYYAPCCDLVKMWDIGKRPKLVIVDGRIPSVANFIHKSRDEYHVFLSSNLKKHAHLNNGFNYLYHTVLVHKSLPLGTFRLH